MKLALLIVLSLFTFASQASESVVTNMSTETSEKASEQGLYFQCNGTCANYINGVFVGTVTVSDSCYGDSVNCTVLANPCRVIAECR